MPPILKSTLIVAREKMLTYSNSTRFGLKFLGTIEPAEPLNKDEILELVKLHFMYNDEEINSIRDDSIKFWNRVNNLALFDIEKLGEYNKHRVAYFLRDEACNGEKEAIKVLENMMRRENWGVTTALLRHEVAFIFGQVYEHAQESGEV